MDEYYSIPSQEEAERFSEAYLSAQQSYHDSLEAELKPCPFCGSRAEYTGECDMVWVRCSNEDCWCQLVTRFDEPEEAAEEWNRRADNG